MTDGDLPRPDGARRRLRQLAALSRTVTACRLCPRLVAWREAVAVDPPARYRGETYWARPLPGFGDAAARLIVVGLAPAAHGGNRTGRLFTGDRSGDILLEALWRAGFANQANSTSRDDGLELTDCYITAAVRCAPPENRPSTDERDQCAPYLAEELALLDEVRVVVCLGAFAYTCVWREASRAGSGERMPPFRHGLEATLPRRLGRAPTTVLCSYHPSQRNVFTGLLTPPMLDAVLGRAGVLCGSD